MNESFQVREAHFILPLLLWKDPRVRHRSQDDLQTEQELCDQACLHAQVGMVKQANTEPALSKRARLGTKCRSHGSARIRCAHACWLSAR